MKFALVNGQKQEAQPRQRGVCRDCQSDMVAHCGRVKIWHWKHKRKQECDLWWENETEWHRNWKNHFCDDWQEICHINSKNGEKHRADIKTVKGLIIEFQHSPIELGEMQSREAFYENMVWVINCARLKSDWDYKLFCNGFSNIQSTIVDGYFRLGLPDKCFRESWIACSVPVYFDFNGYPPVNHSDKMRDDLWCLLPGREDQDALVARISKKQFVNLSSTDPRLLPNRDRFSEQVRQIQAQFAEAIEVAATMKKIKEEQAAAHERYLNSLIPRRFMRKRL